MPGQADVDAVVAAISCRPGARRRQPVIFTARQCRGDKSLMIVNSCGRASGRTSHDAGMLLQCAYGRSTNDEVDTMTIGLQTHGRRCQLPLPSTDDNRRACNAANF